MYSKKNVFLSCLKYLELEMMLSLSMTRGQDFDAVEGCFSHATVDRVEREYNRRRTYWRYSKTITMDGLVKQAIKVEPFALSRRPRRFVLCQWDKTPESCLDDLFLRTSSHWKWTMQWASLSSMSYFTRAHSYRTLLMRMEPICGVVWTIIGVPKASWT